MRTFLWTLLLLLAVVVALSFPYFVGHGLANVVGDHAAYGVRVILAGFAALALAAGLVWLTVRGARTDRGRPPGPAHGGP
jgi:uncharacterized membrane protein